MNESYFCFIFFITSCDGFNKKQYDPRRFKNIKFRNIYYKGELNSFLVLLEGKNGQEPKGFYFANKEDITNSCQHNGTTCVGQPGSSCAKEKKIISLKILLRLMAPNFVSILLYLFLTRLFPAVREVTVIVQILIFFFFFEISPGISNFFKGSWIRKCVFFYKLVCGRKFTKKNRFQFSNSISCQRKVPQ